METPNKGQNNPGRIISFPQKENQEASFLSEKREFYIERLKEIIENLENGVDYDQLIVVSEVGDNLEFISASDAVSMLGLLEMAKLQLMFADLIEGMNDSEDDD